MTWARFRPELATEAVRDQLSHEEFRLHLEASLWIYATEDSRLRVPRHMLRMISAIEAPEDAAAGLGKRGWWKRAGEDWVIVKDANVFRQSFHATEAKRERDRKSQAEARKKRKSGGKKSAAASVTDSANESSDDLTTYLTTSSPVPPTYVDGSVTTGPLGETEGEENGDDSWPVEDPPWDDGDPYASESPTGDPGW